jgi:hypothetical protein
MPKLTRQRRAACGEVGAVNGVPQRVHLVAGPEVDVRELLSELVDAHADTVQLASGPATDMAWSTHCDYLRDLQRLAQEMLACI